MALAGFVNRRFVCSCCSALLVIFLPYLWTFFLQTRWVVYVERNIVALLRNHCCHRNATGVFSCIVDLHVAISNINPFRDAQ